MRRFLINLARRLDVAGGALRCAGCGCTDRVACDGGCSWASLSPALCTSCVAEEADSW